MIDTFYLKLRANLALDCDVELAQQELKGIFTEVRPVSKWVEVVKFVPLPRKIILTNTRRQGVIGFVVKGRNCHFSEVLHRVSFIQEIWFRKNIEMGIQWNIEPWSIVLRITNENFVCAVPLMAAAELLGCIGAREPDIADLRAITMALTTMPVQPTKFDIVKVVRRATSTPHVHGLHRYKAKFFPRMIRSFLLANMKNVPNPPNGKPIVLDPFVGSGTALVEAGLLGYESVGIDIDKLSCAIAQAKLDVMNIQDPRVLKDAINRIRTDQIPRFRNSKKPAIYKFPPWIAKKFERWGSHKEQKEYELQIGSWLGILARVNPPNIRRILEISLSDAISRKFNLRMMGTGVGRFALEIANTDLSTLVNGNFDRMIRAAYTCSTMREAYSLNIPKSRVVRDTATAMPVRDNSVSAVITSPPYLPASSGRENYLIGKSISITALGLLTSKEIQNAEMRSVGSMKSQRNGDLNGLPDEVYKLHNWLKNDELREIKADPTLIYYQDLKRALDERPCPA